MNDNFRFALTVAMPVLATLLFTLLERFTAFGKMPKLPRQLIIGAVFAVSAIMATQWGLESESSIINVRDASPICAAFIFGPVPGFISAAIGAGYRVLVLVLWGKGEFSMIACALSTLIAGVCASIIQIVNNKRRRTMFFVLMYTIVAESTHMLLVFMTHFGDVTSAYLVVSKCLAPVICFTILTTVVSFFVALLVRGQLRSFSRIRKEIGISDIMVRVIVISMAVAYLFMGILTFVMETNASLSRVYDMLYTQLTSLELQIDNEVYQSIKDEMTSLLFFSKSGLVPLTDIQNSDIIDENMDGKIDENDISAHLEDICLVDWYLELDLISKDHTIIHSNKKEMIGKEFRNENLFNALDKNGNYVDVEITTEGQTAYAGSLIMDGNTNILKNVRYLAITYNEAKIESIIRQYVYSSTESFHFGSAGTVLILQNETDEYGNYLVLKPLDDRIDTGLPETINFFDPKTMKPYQRYVVDFKDKKHHMVYSIKDNMYLVTLLDRAVSMQGRDISVMVTQLIEVDIFAFVCLILFIGIKIHVTKNLNKVNEKLGKICDGDLNVTMDVRANREFAELSDDINSTVDTLKHYIEAEAKRIDGELALAKKIQTTALPRVFPPFPGHKEFDIFAEMITAKEVGGDFYDFFFIGKNRLAFLIADVSGKGIPAALFMMTARTTIKGIALQGKPINEVVEIANRQLCENNPSKMFVTMWMGFFDTVTGELQYVNAGHNPPLLYRDGKYEFLKGRTGFILAGIRKSKYEYKTITLSRGDRILLYTDGVTEAKSKDGIFYTEPRLQRLLNSGDISDPKEICESVVADVNSFSADCEQTDDITLLSLCYNGFDKNVSERKFSAKPENTKEAVQYVFDTLTENGCSEIIANRFRTCTDELFSNIVKYAYPEKDGEAVVRVEVTQTEAKVSFVDQGIPFDPLEYTNSEIDLPAKNRKPGGLGIFIVKKLMDNVEYSYENGENRLTLTKNL